MKALLSVSALVLVIGLATASATYRLEATQDSTLENSYPFYGGHFQYNLVAYHPGYPKKRFVIQFEDPPATCHVVEKAKMYLSFAYAHKASGQSDSQVPNIRRDLSVHQVNKEWVESQVSRTNRKTGLPWSAPYLALDGSDASPYVQDTVTINPGQPRGYVEFDITEAMQNWKTGQPNYGLLVWATNEDIPGRDLRFWSRDNTNNRPYVTVNCIPNFTMITTPPTRRLSITTGSASSMATGTSGALRLVSNSGRTGGSSGRLEVYYSGQWGTVCDDDFDVNDARVACRQLGYSDYPEYGRVGLLGFNQASHFTRIWLNNLHCSGSESRLIDCPANTIGNEDCSHFEDIALICTESPPSAIIGGVVGTIAFLIFCFILTAIVIYVVSLSRKRRSGFQYRTFTVGPVSSAVSLAQTSTNIQATAYPLQHPVNLALYPSGPQQTPATIDPLIEGEPGEPKNPELHSNAPSTYPGLNYPSVSLPVAMDVSNNYPGQ